MQNIPPFLRGVYKSAPMSQISDSQKISKAFPPTPTEEIINRYTAPVSRMKEAGQAWQPQRSTITQPVKEEVKETPKKTVYPKDEFFMDAKKIEQAKGLSSQEALYQTMGYYKSRGYGIEGLDIDSEMKNIMGSTSENQYASSDTSENEGFLTKAGKFIGNGIKNLAGGLSGGAPQAVGNTLGFGADILTPEKYEGLGDYLREAGQSDKQKIQDSFNIDPNSFLTKGGEFATELLVSSALPGSGAKLAGKIPGAGKIVKTAKSAVQGAVEMGKFGVVSDGTEEGVAKNIALGAVTNPIIGGVAKVGKGVMNSITKSTPENLIVSGLVNPADLRNASERIAKLTGKEAEIADVSRWLLDRGIKGSKDEMREQISKLTKNIGTQVKTSLKSVSGVFDDDAVKTLQEALREKASTYMKKTVDGVSARAGSKELVDKIQKITGKKKLTLSEVDEGVRIISKDLFNISGDLKDSATKEGWQNAWVGAKKFIETQAPGVRKLNKDLEVGIALNKAIAKKEARELSNQLAGYIGIGASIGGIGGYNAGQDPVGIIQSALMGGVLGYGGNKTKNILNSSTVKTNIATLLNKLPKVDRTIVESAIKNGEIEKLPPKTISVLRKILNIEVGENTEEYMFGE